LQSWPRSSNFNAVEDNQSGIPVYADRMKSRLVIRLLLFVTSGGFFGRCVQWEQAKWNRLGREAFLSYQQHRFDHYMANPRAGTGYLIVVAIFALGLGALFEVIAYAGARVIALLVQWKSGNSQ
jgi:hypothetical protein